MKEIWKNRSLETLEGEIWKDVVGYEGIYQISNLCRIKSMPRLWKLNSKGKTMMNEKILKWMTDFHGYLVVELRNNGDRKGGFSHRLIAQAFIQNPENKPEINHINGIKNDNRIENLEWCTKLENIQHSCRTGLRRDNRGITHYRSLPVMVIDEKNVSVTSYCSMSMAAKYLGVKPSSVCRYVRKNRKYRNLKFQLI